MRAGDNSIAADMLLGALAGAVGVWVMDRVDWFNYIHEDSEARRRTQRVRPGGEDPAHVAAGMVEKAVGAELSLSQHHVAAMAVHYTLGIGPGALSGALRDRIPAVGAGRGTLYGLGLFLVEDEMINAATGLSADQRKYPWQAHARGLVAHLVYGVVTDTVLTVLQGAIRSQSVSGRRRCRA